ncbi:MAG TPA: 2-hydroxyacyl-CoA dehydratase family protein [Deltaproteobacteria bacterium]|nr:2-hydroxyacyl-CoA dehydratase family protein [Deltaproteobacteria bacterium]HPP80338.1 2-hydroxyacyl-CoA dehydratase family protein [Deltaproteobacteria bacterium]
MAPFVEAVDNREERLREWASLGARPMGYLCTYTPVELIHACGFLPVRLWGGAGQVRKAYSHVPPFVCPYLRLVVERAACSTFDFLVGIVQGYTCDAACGVVNVWKNTFGGGICMNLPLPYNESASARTFFASCAHDLASRLEALGGCFSEERLGRSVGLYERIRESLARVGEMCSGESACLSAMDISVVVQAFFSTPPETYLAMLQELEALLQGAPRVRREGVPVLVSGSVLEDAGVIGLIEETGFRVVACDLCTGIRAYTPHAGTGSTPMERLASRHAARFPCPSRSRPQDRVPLLAGLARDSGAAGVIFLIQKFCTPHLADHPLVERGLRDAGIPSILIELDVEDTIDARTANRLETFAALVGG